jgi:hypothetical protein
VGYDAWLSDYDSGFYTPFGQQTLDGSAGNDVLITGYGSFQAFSGSSGGLSLVDEASMGDASIGDYSEFFVMGTSAGGTNADGCSDLAMHADYYSGGTFQNTLNVYLGVCP